MALVGIELETLVFEPDAQTTRPPPWQSPKKDLSFFREKITQILTIRW